MTGQLLDTMLLLGSVDLIEALAFPLPVTVIQKPRGGTGPG
jgi:hypothetical protein